MLFKRYANPFLLLDNLINVKGLSEFINTLNNKVNEDTAWEYYLHRVFDKSFDEWKSEIEGITTQETSTKSLQATVKDSKNILSDFSPQVEE